MPIPIPIAANPRHLHLTETEERTCWKMYPNILESSVNG